ncbi:hypothetical protein [Paenibacillus illinoisensis]|uniref:hypothetical protein n=2 Tax=Paenibacillus TaxID=44249 RepID=UPI003CF4823A
MWGALYSDISIAKFQIEYINGETHAVEAINNTFIVRMPVAFQNESQLSLMETFDNIHAIDANHQVIQSWKPES